MFNVSIRDYGRGKKQVRFYNRPILSDYEIEQDIDMWGEIVPRGAHPEFNPFSDSVEYMRNVPDEARSAYESYRRTKQAIYDISRANVWEWFYTLTFDPQKVDSFCYEACVRKLSNWLIVLRRNNPGVRYILVPELHKSGRFHFHGLFSNLDNVSLIDSGKRDSKDRVIYNCDDYKLGFSTVTKIADCDRAVSYLLKYISKELCAVSFGKKRYWASRNLNKVQITNIYSDDTIEEQLKKYAQGATWVKEVNSDWNKIVYVEVGE